MPALRDRQDKPFIIESIFAEEAERLGLAPALDPEALQCLLAHDWPGNIRELRNALRFAVALAGHRGVTVDDLPPEVQGCFPVGPCHAPGPSSIAIGNAVDPADLDASRLLQALKASRWSITSTARELKVCRATIYRQMKRHGITQPHLL